MGVERLSDSVLDFPPVFTSVWTQYLWCGKSLIGGRRLIVPNNDLDRQWGLKEWGILLIEGPTRI